ncbi:MAG: hypothetical protein GY943_04695 [Chloroflexi bacterium]|nr:hypothetical protein [Chloroflexota bacterium]
MPYHQLTLRLDDTLYHTPLDPTGVGLMVNCQFSMVVYSHVINHWLLTVDYCQFFYGVLTNTLTPELETALIDQGILPQPANELVHLGQGRYYDPSFMKGRHL